MNYLRRGTNIANITVNLAVVGIFFLTLYIVADMIRKKTKNIYRRLIFYSFILYLIIVGQLTTGGITFPPEENPIFRVQLIPFYFIYDWFLVKNMGNWFFWNTVKLSCYNLIMLFPLGVYLALLFSIKQIKKATIIIFFISFIIEIYQFILGYYGYITLRTFNIDDLILNTLGGSLGFIAFGLMKKAMMRDTKSR